MAKGRKRKVCCSIEEPQHTGNRANARQNRFVNQQIGGTATEGIYNNQRATEEDITVEEMRQMDL